jgi:hypothetical protein
LALKNKKNIIIVFNLILFISSLLFSAFSNVLSQPDVTSKICAQHTVNRDSKGVTGCSQLVCEEVENESENDLHEPSILLPFSIAYIDFEVPQFSPVSAQPLAKKLNNPIYLSVRNFRI